MFHQYLYTFPFTNTYNEERTNYLIQNYWNIINRFLISKCLQIYWHNLFNLYTIKYYLFRIVWGFYPFHRLIFSRLLFLFFGLQSFFYRLLFICFSMFFCYFMFVIYSMFICFSMFVCYFMLFLIFVNYSIFVCFIVFSCFPIFIDFVVILLLIYLNWSQQNFP